MWFGVKKNTRLKLYLLKLWPIFFMEAHASLARPKGRLCLDHLHDKSRIASCYVSSIIFVHHDEIKRSFSAQSKFFKHDRSNRLCCDLFSGLKERYREKQFHCTGFKILSLWCNFNMKNVKQKTVKANPLNLRSERLDPLHPNQTASAVH